MSLRSWCLTFSPIFLENIAQMLWDWIKIVGEKQFLMTWLRFELWWGHANMFKFLDLNHLSEALTVCLGSLSCWTSAWVSQVSDWTRVSLEFPCVPDSIQLSWSCFPVPADENHAHICGSLHLLGLLVASQTNSLITWSLTVWGWPPLVANWGNVAPQDITNLGSF